MYLIHKPNNVPIEEDVLRQVGFSGHWDRLGLGMLLPFVGDDTMTW